MSVRFGVHTGQQDLALDDLRALWRDLDAAGLDWISLWDHFYEAPPVDGLSPHFEAIASLAALAADTRRVRVACMVFCIPYRNPALLAKALTTLDHLSHGRLEVGLGAGWHELEFRAYGYDFGALRQRMDMLEEGVQIVRSMLHHQRTTFQGRYFSVQDATCQPAPVQPRVPIWIGGRGEKRTLRLAARYADGWNVAYVGPDQFRRLSAVLDHWCDVEGRDPASVRRGVNLAFACSTTDAPARVQAALRDKWGPAADRLLEGSLLGSPHTAADRITQYLQAGAQDVNIALRAPWDAEALRIYVQDVVPTLRRRFT